MVRTMERTAVRKSKYVQRVIDIVYERGCVKRETIVDVLVKELQERADRVENAVKQALKRLVRAGVIEKRGRGYYCKPA